MITLGLFVERIGTNIIKYSAITRACDSRHSVEQCRENRVYKRNQDQQKAFKEFQANGGDVMYTPLAFAGSWADQMYDGLFFYFGHNNIDSSDNISNVATLFALTMLALIFMFYRGPPKLNSSQKLIVIIVLFYVATLFYFNLNKYLNSAAMFGFQGRYLFPILPFIYLFLVTIVVAVYKQNKKKFNQNILLSASLIIFGAVMIFNHLPILTFYRGADPSWYTNTTVVINTKVHNILDKTGLAKKGSLPYVSEYNQFQKQ